MESKAKPGTALVTGGAVRLGRAIALGLAEMGYDIALHYNASENGAHSTRNEIEALGRSCDLYRCNLAEELCASLIDSVFQAHPSLSLLVNSASAYAGATIRETTSEIFDQQMNLNLKAPFFLARQFANRLTAGNIINIIDNKVQFNQYHYAAYLLSKKMLAELTKLQALEFAPSIRVNGVAPGVVLPASSRSEQYINWRIDAIPVKRKGEAEHIVSACRYILENDFVTGQILFVDGGEGLTSVGRNAESYGESNR